MWLYLIFSLTLSACFADVFAVPPVRCGEMPRMIFPCIGNPRIIPNDYIASCGKSTTQCEKMTCTFRNAGWLKDGKVDQQKVSARFDEFAKDNPAWAVAVEQMKANCLGVELPAQGLELNCPPYDITICSLNHFIKNVQPSQWSNEERCEYPKQFAASCPVCPSECFAPLIPVGSCNACLALPRSP